MSVTQWPACCVVLCLRCTRRRNAHGAGNEKEGFLLTFKDESSSYKPWATLTILMTILMTALTVFALTAADPDTGT